MVVWAASLSVRRGVGSALYVGLLPHLLCVLSCCRACRFPSGVLHFVGMLVALAVVRHVRRRSLLLVAAFAVALCNLTSFLTFRIPSSPIWLRVGSIELQVLIFQVRGMPETLPTYLHINKHEA